AADTLTLQFVAQVGVVLAKNRLSWQRTFDVLRPAPLLDGVFTQQRVFLFKFLNRAEGGVPFGGVFGRQRQRLLRPASTDENGRPAPALGSRQQDSIMQLEVFALKAHWLRMIVE